MPNGAELFVRACAQLGLDPIFTLVGDHLNEVLAAAARAGMRVVDMRHESGVTHAADAWARIHRRPALSLVALGERCGGCGKARGGTPDKRGGCVYGNGRVYGQWGGYCRADRRTGHGPT